MIFSFLIATFVMSDILLAFYVYSTKIGENSDISKCFEDFVSQALGFLTRNCAAELRYKMIGNAVPVNLAYHVAMSIRYILDKHGIAYGD